MPIYHTDQRKHHLSYGASIGILLLKTRTRFILGDVGNACTFDFPVQYKVVEESSIERLIFNADSTLADPIVKAAIALEQAGVSAITANCGYMALFQKQVSEAVNIPVFLSSLMQIPFINSINANNIFIAGMEKQKNFWSAIMDEQGILDSNAIEKEVVAVASDLRQRAPNIGAILLECSDLPPYSAAVQEALKLPVFDFVTMIKYVFSSVAQNQ